MKPEIKLCVDCKFYKPVQEAGDWLRYYCTYKIENTCLVTGNIIRREEDYNCFSFRGDQFEDYCGPEGKYFEAICEHDWEMLLYYNSIDKKRGKLICTKCRKEKV
jgi:hypothetical protein